jgi:ribose-phosphate pyrophosphokinase
METYNPWYTQDKRDVGYREPDTGQLVADLYKAAGMSHLFYFEPHSLPGLEGWYKPLDPIYMAAFHAAHLRNEFELNNTVVGVPDEGSISRSKYLSDALKIPLVKIGKTRDYEKQDEISKAMNITTDISGMTVILYDDMIRTGSTAKGTSKSAKEAGASKVIYVATHLEITKPEELFGCEYIDVIRGTDTNPLHPVHPKLSIYDIAPFAAEIIHRRSRNRDISGFAGDPNQIQKVLKI